MNDVADDTALRELGGAARLPDELGRLHELLSLVLERSADFVTIISVHGEIVYANRTVRTFFGVSPNANVRELPPGLGFSRASRRVLRDEAWPALLRTGEWTGELTLLSPAGERVTVLQSSQLHPDADGRPWFVSGIGRNITDLKVAQRRLARLATRDGLTGLPNRAAAIARFSQLRETTAAVHSRHAVLFVDLDDFKGINDRYGHAVGDAVLAVVGARLREAVRPDDFVARLGGDEFVVLCEEPDVASAASIERRIAAALHSPIALDDTTIVVSASVGRAPIHGSDPFDALRDADRAMYRAKRARAAVAQV